MQCLQLSLIFLFHLESNVNKCISYNFWQAGGLRSEKWRSEVDDLLIAIAVDSFEEGFNEEISMFGKKESAATSADFQLAALRALLASFLSFSQTRPPHLSQGLELFHRGNFNHQYATPLILIDITIPIINCWILCTWRRNVSGNYYCED